MVTRVLIVIASLAVIGLIVGAMIVMRGGSSTASPSPSPTVSTDAKASSTGLVSTDETVGTGDVAEAGKTVSVNYVGTLSDGTKFDSSYDRNQPFEFQLGAGQVIKGWDQGVVGMKVGGKRKLVIPPDLGYGDQANGKIPANSTLTFEIELLAVK